MVSTPVPYRRLVIFYFSGTGNARFAAQKIAMLAREKGVEATVYNIAYVFVYCNKWSNPQSEGVKC